MRVLPPKLVNKSGLSEKEGEDMEDVYSLCLGKL